MPATASPTGYLSAAFAASFSNVGEPIFLSESGGWLLRRRIPGVQGAVDATNPYPLFSCSRWSALEHDLASLDEELVSVTCVTDPLGEHTPELLRRCFPEMSRPFKEHLIVDTERSSGSTLPENHRRNIAKAARQVDVEFDVLPSEVSSEWVDLYATLVDRHAVTGLAAFDPPALRQQLLVPGARISRAMADDETVAVQVWYVQGDSAYYHLGASSPRGYSMSASFALTDGTIRHLADEARYLDLGAGPGIEDREDGLTRFKRPWANAARTAYLCGRIGQRSRYRELASAPRAPSSFFPAYRTP